LSGCRRNASTTVERGGLFSSVEGDACAESNGDVGVGVADVDVEADGNAGVRRFRRGRVLLALSGSFLRGPESL